VEEASALREAVRVDTPELVHLGIDGPTLDIRLTARSAASARATLEDLLACLKVAERTAGEQPGEGRRAAASPRRGSARSRTARGRLAEEPVR